MTMLHDQLNKAVNRVIALRKEQGHQSVLKVDDFKYQIFSGNSYIRLKSSKADASEDKRKLKFPTVIIDALDPVEQDDSNPRASDNFFNFSKDMFLADFMRQLAYFAKEKGGELADVVDNLENINRLQKPVFDDFKIDNDVIIAWLFFFDDIAKSESRNIRNLTVKSQNSLSRKRSTARKPKPAKKVKPIPLGLGYQAVTDLIKTKITTECGSSTYSIHVKQGIEDGEYKFQFCRKGKALGKCFYASKGMIRAAGSQYLNARRHFVVDSEIDQAIDALLPNYEILEKPLFLNDKGDPLDIPSEKLIYALLMFTNHWKVVPVCKKKEAVMA
ncbi:MAG TPA: hypothetical protein DCL21_01045 [Alphaproteobacteria bacterium]|nr:hypothetical protein [Alphaproteobacteria bacterium]